MIAGARPALRYVRLLPHFASTRGLEVSLLQASPALGLWIGGLGFATEDLARAGLLLLGSVTLTAHVFVLNDWAYSRGHEDPATPRDEIVGVAIGLLAFCALAFATLGVQTLLFGAAIAALSALYSLSPRLGKGTPVAASANHLVGGSLHFLMGYSQVHEIDLKGIAISSFFGLVFAAGHLNQEVRDHEADSAEGIRTSAVVFGCRKAFVASFCLFTIAYALLVGMVLTGELPRVLLVVTVIWLVQASWTSQALRRGLDMETALWMQRRYRALCGLVGLLMLVV